MGDVLLVPSLEGLVVPDPPALAACLGLSDREAEVLARGVSGGSGWTQAIEKKMLDHFFTNPGYTPPATMYLALSTTTPADDGTNFTEPSTGSYARVSLAAAQMNASVTGEPCQATNSAARQFPSATAQWSGGSNMTYYGLFDAASAGTILWFAALTVAKPVNNGDTPQFAVASLVFELGDPSDSF